MVGMQYKLKTEPTIIRFMRFPGLRCNPPVHCPWRRTALPPLLYPTSHVSCTLFIPVYMAFHCTYRSEHTKILYALFCWTHHPLQTSLPVHIIPSTHRSIYAYCIHHHLAFPDSRQPSHVCLSSSQQLLNATSQGSSSRRRIFTAASP